MNELEVGLISNNSRYSNKKMRKRKHLDALIKFRSNKRNSNEIIQSSENELFLPNQTSIQRTKTHSSLINRFCIYSKEILIFCFICIFIIICINLISTNIQLKTQVDRLSIRISEIENRVADVNIKNLSSIVEQFQIRLNYLEHWKDLFKTRLNQRQLDEETIANVQLENLLQQLTEFRNEIENLNNLIRNSSDKTSITLNEIQSKLDDFKIQIDQCNCSNNKTDFYLSELSILENNNSINSSSSEHLPTLGKTIFKSKSKNELIEQIVN